MDNPANKSATSNEGQPREQEKSDNTSVSQTEDEDDDQSGFCHKWLDEGTSETAQEGRREHESVMLTMHGTSFRVNKGDFVLLWKKDRNDQETDDSEDADIMDRPLEDLWQKAGCAKIERLFEVVDQDIEGCNNGKDNTSSNSACFRARWFFQKRDVEKVLKKQDFADPTARHELLDNMGLREVVGSPKVETLPLDAIGGPARIFFRGIEKKNKPEPPLPSDAFVCRYTIKRISPTPKRQKSLMEVVPYNVAEEDDNEDFMEVDPANSELDTTMEQDDDDDNRNNDTMGEDDSSDSGSSSDDDGKPGVPEGEGSTLKGQIRVGPQHQVEVPAYDPANKAQVRSRNPVLVWKPNNPLSEEQLDAFYAKAGEILTPYAEHNQLTMGNDPYTSIPADLMEDMMRKRKGNAPLTVSTISTALSLSSKNQTSPNNLVRECDVDAILALLHEKNYDTAVALEALAAKPLDYLTAWTASEKEKFDNGFRLYAGALRMIAKKTVGPTKSCQDVVDYHYRFKIPDQFRRYVDKKREQAVRMMECIETRRFHHSTAPVNIIQPSTVSDNGDLNNNDTNASGADDDSQPPDAKRRKYGNWSETGTQDVIGAVEERRSAAKELLLDIQRELGKEKLSEVAGTIIALHQGAEGESKAALLRILRSQPQLHERLIEFLPKRFRD